MKKTKEQKGITLVALIITIVILLILAVVTINAIKGDGVLKYAKKARDDYQEAQDNERATLDGYVAKIKDSLENGNSTISMSEAQGKVLSTTETTSVVDGYGNIVKVPAGFKITTDANSVPEGIVIEDCTDAATQGSQFVWIPTGTINTDTQGTIIENPLERRWYSYRNGIWDESGMRKITNSRLF